MLFAILGPLSFAGVAYAHLAVFHKAMYCLNGTVSGVDNQNNNDPVNPLWALPKAEWWFHHTNGCDQFPPAEGDFLELPAGGSFQVEIASNRAFTTLSFDSKYVSDWPDGASHPEDYSAQDPGSAVFSAGGCITAPNMHTQNQSMAAGTAFAISYTSDLSQVTPENLAVFTVAYNTPWKRIATYQVPAAMPPCPAGGCTCAWGWVPNGCGEPNIYMSGFKCNVTGATSNTPVATAQPPVWCEDDTSKCVSGAKQLIYWNQADGNNIEVSGNDLSGSPRSPAYNNKLGFSDGAQNNIFGSGSGTNSPKTSSGSSSYGTSSTSTSSGSTSVGTYSPSTVSPANLKVTQSASCSRNGRRNHFRRRLSHH